MVARRIEGKRRAGQRRGDVDMEVAQKARHIARPADGDRRRAESVFEQQVPADDPGDEFAHGGVGVGIGAARDRHGRGHLGVAKSGKRADKASENEREANRRPRIGRRGMAGQHEDAGADDAADAERNQARERKRAPQIGGVGPELRFVRLGFKFGDRFRDPDAHAALAFADERKTEPRWSFRT